MTATRTAVAALTLSAATLLATAAPAGAAGQDPFVPPPPPDPISDTGWQPFGLLPPSPPTRACGTTIVLDDVERLSHVEQRVREYAGTTRIDYRGQAILTAKAADGRHARLDSSGLLTVVIQQATGVVDSYFRGPTVLLPFDQLAATAFRRAGMPRFSQSSGNTHIRDVIDPETDAFISTKVISRPRFITNACDLLVR